MRRDHAVGFRVEPLENRALLSTLVAESGGNNTVRAAEVVQLDPSDGMGTITGRVSRRDRDFFVLNPTTSGNVQVSLSGAGRGTVSFDIIGGDGQRILHQSARNGVMTGDVSVTAGQAVFLRLRATGPGAAGYQISLREPVADLASTIRPNADSSTPEPITTGTAPSSGASETAQMPASPDASGTTLTLNSGNMAQASGTITTDGGTDVYTLTPPQSGRLTFSIRKNGETPVTLTVTDSTGKQRLKLDSDIPSFVSYFFATAGETYTITIAARGAVPASYTMAVSES